MGAGSAAGEHETAARQHYNVTFALLAIAAIAYALMQSLVAPALPDIQRELHTSVSGVSWVLTAYLLSASIATPLIGRLGDMYGKTRLLVVVLVLLAVATVLSALATTLPVMLVGRVVQGPRAASSRSPSGSSATSSHVSGSRARSASCPRSPASAAAPASSWPGRSSTTSRTTTSSGCP